MSLADEIRQAHPQKEPGPKCGAGRAVASHDERDELERLVAMSDKDHPEYLEASQIAQYLTTTSDWDGSGKTMARHRRGVNGDHVTGCKCGQ